MIFRNWYMIGSRTGLMVLFLFYAQYTANAQIISASGNKIELKEIVTYNLAMLDKEPQNLKAALTLIEAFYRLGAFRESLSYANVAESILNDPAGPKIDPTDKSDYEFYIFQTRGKARHQLGDFRKAMQDYLDALAIKKNDPDLAIDIGNIFYNRQEYDSALLWFREAEKNDLKGFKAKFNIANIFYVYQQYDSALDYYSQSIKLNPYFMYSYFYTGTIHSKMENYDSAVVNFSKAHQLDSNNTEILIQRALSYQLDDKPDKALDDWTNILALDTVNQTALKNRALINSRKGHNDKALSDLSRLVEMNGQDDEVFFSRGYEFFKIGEYAESEMDFMKAIELGYDQGNIYYLLGRINRKFKKKDEACRFLRKAVQKNVVIDRKSERFLSKCLKEIN